MNNRYLDLKEIIVCPDCRSEVIFDKNSIECCSCKRVFHIDNDIPQFALYSKGKDETCDKPTAYYEQRYKDFVRAQHYNQKYAEQLLKRMSTKREYQLINKLLGAQPHCQTLLEIPCGGGRLSSQLVKATDMLIQADIAVGQIQYLLQKNRLVLQNIRHAYMTASAFKMPFQDSSIDGLVCVRLSHHISTLGQRQDLLEELLRVSKKFVLMTFFDSRSFKNIFRQIKGKKQKFTLSVSQVNDIANRNGASLVACPRLSVIGSGHRYALLIKQ